MKRSTKLALDCAMYIYDTLSKRIRVWQELHADMERQNRELEEELSQARKRIAALESLVSQRQGDFQ